MTNAKGSCKLDELLPALERLRLNSSRIWLLREVRRGNVLMVQASVESELKNFIASYENDLARSAKRWGRDALDEFSILLEQVPSRRASAQTAGSSN